MSSLVLLRHGESIWNLENRFTGWVDVQLSHNGKIEAQDAGRYIKDIKFDIAFTSILRRAYDTLDIILKVIKQEDIPIIKDKALNERHYGELQGLNKEETAKKYGKEQVFIWRRSYDISPPGGESLKDTAERVIPYYKQKIVPYIKEQKNILIVAHGNSLRALMMYLEDISEIDIPNLNIPTGIPIIYIVDKDCTIIKKVSPKNAVKIVMKRRRSLTGKA